MEPRTTLDTRAGIVRRFIDLNVRLSSRVARLWPHARFNPFRAYEREVASRLSAQDGHKLVVDVGAGHQTPYATQIRDRDRARIVGLDVSLDAMDGNEDLDARRAVDVVADPLPFERGEVDAVVSSSVLEHLPDVETFVAEAARCLTAGGWFIHVFPSRYAWFALLNRRLPNRLVRRLLFSLYPHTVGLHGFPAYYDRCYDSAMRRLLEQHGLEIVRTEPAYYGASPYLSVFLPAFAISLIWEILTWTIRAPNLCATLLVVARKPS
jgi:SAM-dependent methyltransferase